MTRGFLEQWIGTTVFLARSNLIFASMVTLLGTVQVAMLRLDGLLWLPRCLLNFMLKWAECSFRMGTQTHGPTAAGFRIQSVA